MLEVRGLHAGYGEVEVLHGIDIDVAEGEIVAVLGSNGVGKSTLNNNLSGLYRPFARLDPLRRGEHHRRESGAHRRARPGRRFRRDAILSGPVGVGEPRARQLPPW